MPTTIDSTRFGRIEVAPDSEIAFPDGLAGFDSRRFTLVARETDDAFVWLHSLEDPALALPLADPRRFFSAFALEPAPAADAAVYVTVRAPIVIADGVGQQVINEAAGAELRAPLLAELAAAAEQAA